MSPRAGWLHQKYRRLALEPRQSELISDSIKPKGMHTPGSVVSCSARARKRARKSSAAGSRLACSLRGLLCSACYGGDELCRAQRKVLVIISVHSSLKVLGVDSGTPIREKLKSRLRTIFCVPSSGPCGSVTLGFSLRSEERRVGKECR